MNIARTRPLKTPDEIPGWFPPLDRDLFRALLAWQVANQPPGDLLELGCYLGKSAVVIGESIQAGETFTVCDLFGEPSADQANSKENIHSYASLDRTQFERNYLQFHSTLPVILQMPTSQVNDQVAADSARFVHVDASHLYKNVVEDIASARRILGPGGIVVFDDYRSTHTPGVAAAVWTAMANDGLIPVALTARKWYGTWDDSTAVHAFIQQWGKAKPEVRVSLPEIAGHEVLRLRLPRAAAAPSR